MSANNPAPVTITFKKADGPITFQVQGDMGTLGHCSLEYLVKPTDEVPEPEYVLNAGSPLELRDNYESKLTIGLDPKDPASVALDPNKLDSVMVHGKYNPPLGLTIVSGSYRFSQKDNLLSPGPIPFPPPDATKPGVLYDDREFDFVGV
jgi:hypothetical protein